MRVIFLDVDGVLNSRPYVDRQKQADAKLPDKQENFYISDSMLKRLAKLYKKYYGTMLVLTSNWKDLDKNDPKWKFLKKKLEENDIRIYDCTSKICKETGEFLTSRPEEIADWLKNHESFKIKYWVSLDDDFDYQDYENVCEGFSKHLCKTEYGELDDKIQDTGFSNLKYHEALEILGGVY